MSYGTVTVEGAVFTESFDLSESGRTLSVKGQESTPPNAKANVLQLHANVIGLEGRTVPVLFSQKSERNGFYAITSAKAELFEWADGIVTTCTWQLDMQRIGSGADVEFESRVPTLARSTELTGASVTPWHAPAYPQSYYTGSAVPTQIVRTGTEGIVPTFTGIPANVSPRWTTLLPNYMLNACDLYLNGLYAVGMLTPNGVTSWSFDNGLVRVQSATGSQGIDVSVWVPGIGWSTSKRWAFNGGPGGFPELTVLRNDPEELTVRLTYVGTPGRFQVDLSLRRGSRFITVQVARQSTTTLGTFLSVAEPGTSQIVGTASQVGGVMATAADAQGVKYLAGSSKVVSVSATTGGISKNNVTRFDAFIGAEIGTAQVGDRFADLHAQYLGTNSERTRVVLR